MKTRHYTLPVRIPSVSIWANGLYPPKGLVKPVSVVRKFACLTYHVIGKEESQYCVSQEQFRNQLALLRADGYVVDSFEQLEGRLCSDQQFPAQYVVLTVDDGHESAMNAADLLGEYGFQASLFLTRDRCLQKPGFLRAPAIRELRRNGFSVGTHGTTHRKLTWLSENTCIGELLGSKEWLEDLIGEEIRYMAAPGGFVTSHLLRLARKLGYVFTGTCNEWMNSPRDISPLGAINRVNIRRQFSLHDFRRIVEGELSFYIWRQVRAATLAVPKQLLAMTTTSV